MKTIDEMIKVMEHFKNGGEIEISSDKLHWWLEKCPKWNWGNVDYRIKEIIESKSQQDMIKDSAL